MITIEELQKQIDEINKRNERVQADKAWETSYVRKGLIIVLTYIVVVAFFVSMRLPNPYINAIVPAGAFAISTLTIPLAKRWWMRKNPRG